MVQSFHRGCFLSLSFESFLSIVVNGKNGKHQIPKSENGRSSKTLGKPIPGKLMLDILTISSLPENADRSACVMSR